MGIYTGLGTRVCRGGLLTAAAVLASAGIALAANAIAGGSYAGHYTGGTAEAISFKVSANGKKITDLDASTPIHCGGGCGGIGSVSDASARIHKNKFNVTAQLYFAPTHSSEGTETITGKFLTGGGAKGTVSSHFKHGSSSDRTAHWTATS